MEKKDWVMLVLSIVVIGAIIGGVVWYQTNKMRAISYRTVTGNASCQNGVGQIEFSDLYGTGTCIFYADFIIWPDFKSAVLDVPGVDVVFDSDSQYGFTIRMADRFFSSNKVYNLVALKLCTLQARELRGDEIWRLRR